VYVYDVEVYPNYMSIGFMSVKTKRVKQFWTKESAFSSADIKRIKRVLNVGVIGFNSKGYDDVMTSLMLAGRDCNSVYKKSKQLIESSYQWWEVFDKLNVNRKVYSIDLIDIAFGNRVGLKEYGARMNSKKLQDLPYDPHVKLNDEQIDQVNLYNVNDLNLTLDLYTKLTPEIDLRKQISNKYNIDVMSKSDAQIAEAIFRHELTEHGVNVKRGEVPKVVKYVAPESVAFDREDLNEIVDRIEESDIELASNGSPMLPKWLKDTTISIGDTEYNIGLGGLHSKDKQLVVIPKEDEMLSNVDVASYYPSLIISLKLYPKQLTKKFLDVYSNIKKERLEAKRNGDSVTNNVLKIVLNGSYGKFGNKYSFLYDPNLLLGVTFTGQLYLLMLIEMLEKNGFKVVSSNTDGVEVLHKKYKINTLKEIVGEWEYITEMEMEFGQYNALFARDVNNYIALYPGGKTKAKGCYLDPQDAVPKLSKNIEYPIVHKAIRDYIANGTPLEDTIYNCKDVAMFTSSVKVKGGAIYYPEEIPDTEEYTNHILDKGELKVKAVAKRNEDHKKKFILESDKSIYLGKVVRWYYSINSTSAIFYKTGNKVGKTDGAKPMMDLTRYVPKDLDYDKYIALAVEHFENLGVSYGVV